MVSSTLSPIASTVRSVKNSLSWYYDLVRGRSFALNDLDKKLASIMNKRGGFFIEAGANDGKSQSNTLLLERYYGWKGLLIEPIPELFEKCKLNRPKCLCQQAALVPLNYPEDSIKIHCCGLMSTVEGSMGSHDAVAEHIASGAQAQNLTPYVAHVPARPLSAILDQFNIEQIDLLSLDVEGFEANALQGLDFDRHSPKFILVEERFPEAIAAILQSRYQLIGELSFHDKLYALRPYKT